MRGEASAVVKDTELYRILNPPGRATRKPRRRWQARGTAEERGVGVGPAQRQGTEVREPAAGCRALCLQLRRRHLGRTEAPFF